MNRRRYLALASAIPLAGCTGRPGDPITMLAVNQDDSQHSVTVWLVRQERLAIANTVEVSSGDTAEIGTLSWERGRYRVTVRVDGEAVLAREFLSEEWFNQLDVFIGSDETIELNRGTAA
ncbi:MAG: hypothetical protein ACOCS7_02655 [Halolamina sp.]